jgi:predicted RNase H-like nuclease (RuvC/YqgF family)
MPFATLDEAWGDIKPYINYNPILNQNNSNVEQTTTKMETIRVNEPTIQNNANTDEKLNNLENNIEKNNIDLKNEIVKLNNKIEKLIRSNNKQVNAITNNDFLTKNMNDILLFMIFGLFIMLLMDLFYKIICSKISRK